MAQVFDGIGKVLAFILGLVVAVVLAALIGIADLVEFLIHHWRS